LSQSKCTFAWHHPFLQFNFNDVTFCTDFGLLKTIYYRNGLLNLLANWCLEPQFCVLLGQYLCLLWADPYPPWTLRCTSFPPPFPFMHCYWRKKN
jgi:hypothetical protein